MLRLWFGGSEAGIDAWVMIAVYPTPKEPSNIGPESITRFFEMYLLRGALTACVEEVYAIAMPPEEREHQICLTVATVSFLVWLTNSFAVSNTIQALSRLGRKFLGH